MVAGTLGVREEEHRAQLYRTKWELLDPLSNCLPRVPSVYRDAPEAWTLHP